MMAPGKSAGKPDRISLSVSKPPIDAASPNTRKVFEAAIRLLAMAEFMLMFPLEGHAAGLVLTPHIAVASQKWLEAAGIESGKQSEDCRPTRRKLRPIAIMMPSRSYRSGKMIDDWNRR